MIRMVVLMSLATAALLDMTLAPTQAKRQASTDQCFPRVVVMKGAFFGDFWLKGAAEKEHGAYPCRY